MKMKNIKHLTTLLFALIPFLGANPDQIFHKATGVQDCRWNDIDLYGKVRFVESFPDIRVQIVDHFPDLKVQYVEHFPDECGKWQVVEHFPDFTVQFVDHFPDLKVQVVEHFPGLP
jgi:hypothetical protein